MDLEDIEHISIGDLDIDRLQGIQSAAGPLEALINNPSEPITLDGSQKPYAIIDGRYRVFLARQNDFITVMAELDGRTEDTSRLFS